MFHGVRIGSNIHLLHLFYADDVIILLDWNQNDMENITKIINIFYIASGLKINFHKLNVFGVGVSNSEVVSMAACTGCEVGSFPFSYLGLPIGSNVTRIANWQILIDRFKARLSGWKANLLSIGGRLTLIKSVLGSLGIYYFSIIKALEMVIKSLESLHVKFFWGSHESSKKLSWVKWSNTLASFDKGGLGVGSLSASNKALLLKWRWRLFNFLNSLWVQVIKAFRGNEAGIDLEGCQTSGTWAKIVGTINLLHSRPIAMGRSTTEFDNLIIDISYMEIDDLVESDTCVWSLSKDDSFSVNSVRKHIDEHSLPSLFPGTRWYKMIPKKVNIFMWRMLLDTLPNRLNLSSRGLDIDSISCMVCNEHVESNDHVFFTCDTAVQFGRLFDHGLIFLFQAFSRVKIGPTGWILGMFLRTKKAVCIPSLRLLVGLFGV
nr:reverse transcriptase domain, reverse transcriptase zinc-binding domain protein [Tanacetum cinerariifolium]